MITKKRISEIIVEELHKILKSEDRTNLEEARQVKIDKSYTHFLIDKETNKILDAWDYSDLDNESIKDYIKADIKDMGLKPNDVKLYTKSHLKSKGIDPFDEENWELS